MTTRSAWLWWGICALFSTVTFCDGHTGFAMLFGVVSVAPVLFDLTAHEEKK